VQHQLFERHSLDDEQLQRRHQQRLEQLQSDHQLLQQRHQCELKETQENERAQRKVAHLKDVYEVQRSHLQESEDLEQLYWFFLPCQNFLQPELYQLELQLTQKCQEHELCSFGSITSVSSFMFR
jgi:hypothetical protein